MKKLVLIIAIATVYISFLTGCANEKITSDKSTGNTSSTNDESTSDESTRDETISNETTSDETISDETTGDETAILEKITAEAAKKMMDENEELIILDVRTQEEFDTGHIEGAVLIPDSDIKKKAEEILKDKSATILLYCRSGRRSALAAQDLSDLGYTAIYDFGGIIDWTYDVVVE